MANPEPTVSDKRTYGSSALGQLKENSIVVVDTGDLNQIAIYKPQDATTNPSLLLQASTNENYGHIIGDAIAYAKENAKTEDAQLSLACDKLAVNFGVEILKHIPGLVSTEVDPRFSFDTDGTKAKAHDLIKLYEAVGISKDRILIKIATTWEGCQAAKELEKEGIHCNMTLLFSMAQARAAAEADATLISPFVGRILDWHKQKNPELKIASGSDDPGVVSVSRIYNYYKERGFKTTVMGASFRNIGEIIALAGCDKLTISPKLLEELEKKEDCEVQRVLGPQTDVSEKEAPLKEEEYRWMLNQDAMATEKLAEGIRNFHADYEKLKAMVAEKLANSLK